jgi:hypothetical protein
MLAGCTEPAQRPQARVTIDADGPVRGQVDSVQVVVEMQAAGGGGWQVVASRRFTPQGDHDWPLAFNLKPADVHEDASYQLTATASDGRGAVVAQARTVRSFGQGRVLSLRVLFEAECLRPAELCLSTQTCHAHSCVDARMDLGDLTPRLLTQETPTQQPAQADDPTALHVEGEACDTHGARGCAMGSLQVPLDCEDGLWRAQPMCAEGERCDTTAGPQRGACRRVASECIGHAPGEVFCDQDLMRVCANGFASEIRPCAENKHCVAPGQDAQCVCRGGFVEDPAGCRKASDCDSNHGGCDVLASCTMSGGQRMCGACPSGFRGNGESGCQPLLTALTSSAGQLMPAFDPNVDQYRIQVPLLVQRVTLAPVAAAGVQIRLNGETLADGASWTTPTLPFGESKLELTLTSSSGTTHRYLITIARAGTQSAYLKASNAQTGDMFGLAMAMDSDTLVAGALYEDSAASGVNGNQLNEDAPDSGAAYVFRLRNERWEQEAYLKPSDPMRQTYFGTSLAISRDTIVVGASRDDGRNASPLTARPGTAYVFERNSSGWRETAHLAPAEAENGDALGYTVAIDADTLAVAAPRAGAAGAVYVFIRSGAAWIEQQRLTPEPAATDMLFGSSVAVSGDSLLVGAQQDGTEASNGGSAFVFVRHDGRWQQEQRIAPSVPVEGAGFGYTVAIRGDRALVGAPRTASILSTTRTTAGQAFVFDRMDSHWSQTQALQATVPRASDSFGSSVALRGPAALVGAAGDTSGGRGLGADPSRRDAAYAGAAYLFALEGQRWMPSLYLKADNADANDMFGFAVALTDELIAVSGTWESGGDGGVGASGQDNSASRAGAVYVFR